LKSVENNLEGSGISVPMRGMMERLLHVGPQTVPQLAQALLIPRQFAQQIANELRDADLVEQAINRAHKRSWLIRLTQEGQESFERVRAQELAVIKRAAVGLSSDDIDACLRVLAHLTEAFEKVAREGQPEGKRSKNS
jgi:DNA-binding MarR family transcriptional regulator